MLSEQKLDDVLRLTSSVAASNAAQQTTGAQRLGTQMVYICTVQDMIS